MSAGILADLEALSHLEDRFTALHGEEAKRRWGSVGRTDGASAVESQAAAIAAVGPAPAVWETLAWELSERVAVLEQLRSQLREEANG